jgi:ATF/CREB family transcription factor
VKVNLSAFRFQTLPPPFSIIHSPSLFLFFNPRRNLHNAFTYVTNTKDRRSIDAPVDAKSDAKADAVKPETAAAETKPLAPPPRPGQQQTGNTPDFFAGQATGSLSLEPNPFEQSFGAPAPETPGGTKLPSVASLTSPSSLLPGGGTTPFNWGPGSLRTGPLSPAMLSAPANDYFSADHLRGGFPTPNESSLRTGLTPGGSGSMFPAASPNSQALFNLQSGGATPGTLDFQRTAAVAAAAKREQGARPATSQPQELTNGAVAVKGEAKQFDNHDNDAANGLYMLARGQNGVTTQDRFAVQPPPQNHAHAGPRAAAQGVDTSPQMNGASSVASGSIRGGSEAGSAASEESEPARPNTRGRGKRGSNGDSAPATNGRRKAAEPVAKGPAAKKAKTNGAAVTNGGGMMMMDEDDMSDNDDMMDKEGGPKSKMTDEEKRKNFLERNRLVHFAQPTTCLIFG